MRFVIVLKGIKSILPITAGVIPFGLVMGTVASNANLNFEQTTGMNLFVFAGTAQLAAVDLMLQNTTSIIVIITGLIINLRFLLYSASLSVFFKKSSTITKFIASYAITDQSYSALMAHREKLNNNEDIIKFYLGAGITMIIVWHTSVLLGFIFGNFAPPSISLDYAVPLSFVALVMPTLKNKNFVYVTILSSILSIALKPLPYNLGLLCAAMISISLGAFLTKKRNLL